MEIDFIRIQTEFINKMTRQPGGYDSLKVVRGYSLNDLFDTRHFYQRLRTMLFNHDFECYGIFP